MDPVDKMTAKWQEAERRAEAAEREREKINTGMDRA